MSTYTPSLGLELITPGSQAGLWGNTTNNSLNLIDQAITGVTPVSFASASGSTYTLTDFNGAEDESRSAVLNITGSATGANTIVIPNKQKTYLVRNSTGQDVVFQTPTPSATYSVGAGYSILIFCDGNNNVFTGIASPGVGTLSVNAGGTGTTSFVSGGFVKSSGGTNALTASLTVNAATELSGVTPVTNGGTGSSSLTSGALLFGNGTGAVGSLIGGAVGQVPTWNGSGWTSAAPPGGVSSVSAGTGISVSGTTNVTVTNAGVVSVTAGTGVSITGTSSNPVISASGGSGTVTSVGLSMPATFNVTNTPITSSGSIGVSWANQAANTVLAAPSGSSGAPSFRSLTAGDMPSGVFLSATSANNSVPDLFFGGNTSTAPVALGSAGLRVGAVNTNITGSSTQCVIQAGGTGFGFYNTGNATAPGSWISGSDARIKENITTISNGLATVSQLNPVKFSMKKDNLSAPNKHGLIAQELELVIPEVVYETKMEVDGVENVKAVAYTELVPILIKAIQELKTEVDALKAAK